MIFIIDKNSERFLSRKKEDMTDWYENSRSMLNSLIDSNFSLSLCLY